MYFSNYLAFFSHENIISLVDVPLPPTRVGFNDIYIITDLMETDLHRVIYSRNVNLQYDFRILQMIIFNYFYIRYLEV